MTANPATETIWSQLSDDLRRFIRRRVADQHVADDLLQETFLRIHRNVDKLQESDRLAARREGNNIHYRLVDLCVRSLMDQGLCLMEEVADRSQGRTRIGC